MFVLVYTCRACDTEFTDDVHSAPLNECPACGAETTKYARLDGWTTE